MQILPLLATNDTAFTDTISSTGTETGSRQAALFSGLLSGYASGGTTSSTGQTTSSASSSGTGSGSLLDATNAPSQEQLKNLKVTKEDIAALHDALQSQGFSEDEITSLQTKASGDTGMTWGELLSEVNKKKATSTTSKKKDISVDDQTQLLGLFGKLGFSTEESQQLVDSLAKGNVDGVWTSVNAKVSSLSADSTVSLGSSEISALARGMNLSDSAQQRLTKLFDQSTADQGLSGSSLKTAFTLVQNERNIQITQDIQSLQQFRKEASTVLAQAWQRNSTKERSGTQEDDVARKAAQVVSMGGGGGRQRDDSGLTASSTSRSKVNVLADVPESGQGLTFGTQQAQDKAKTMADGLTQNTPTGSLTDQAAQFGRPAQTAQGTTTTGQTASQTANQAANQAATAAKTASTKVQQPQAETSTVSADKLAAQATGGVASGKDTAAGTAGQELEKGPAPTSASSTATNNFVQAAGTGANASGGRSDLSGQSGLSDKEGSWGAFWSKVRSEAGTDSQSSTGFTQMASHTTQTLADGVKAQANTASTTTSDPGLAARVAQQLESGLLRNLGQGTKQLTLTLQPEDLGRLSVTLTVKGKEVQATIKADSTDTTAMLQDQSSQIRQSLENQGFKVSKLDVQTGLAQDNQSSWQGPEQHNQAREQREAMERVRASLRLTQSNDTLAFDVAQAAVLAGSMTAGAQGLDLFA